MYYNQDWLKNIRQFRQLKQLKLYQGIEQLKLQLPIYTTPILARFKLQTGAVYQQL